MIGLFDTYRPSDLITAVSGTTDGVAWTIESVFERRAGFRLFIGGRWLATFTTSMAADEFRAWWFEQNETSTDQVLALSEELSR